MFASFCSCFVEMWITSLHSSEADWNSRGKSPVSIPKPFIFMTFSKGFPISMLLFAWQIDYPKSKTHCTMSFHSAQLRKTLGFNVSGHFKHFRNISADTKVAFPMWLSGALMNRLPRTACRGVFSVNLKSTKM